MEAVAKFYASRKKNDTAEVIRLLVNNALRASQKKVSVAKKRLAAVYSLRSC
jgi:hypothetical protein